MAVVDMALAELRLLRLAEMKSLFPDADVWIERAMGLPKSYTAYRLCGAPRRIARRAAARVPAERVVA